MFHPASNKLQFILLCVLLLFTVATAAQAPSTYALSPIYLKFLSKQERKIYNGMKKYSEALGRRLQLIQRYTSDYEATTLDGTKSVNSLEKKDIMVAENPVLSFRMLSRFAHEFAAIGHHISENAEEATSKIVYNAKGGSEFPTPADVRDAMDAILRFQFIYDLKAEYVANGHISGKSSSDPENFSVTRVTLNAKHCFALGKNAKRNFQYTLAMDWFNVTGSKLQNDPNALNKFGMQTLKTAISATVAEHDQEHESNLEDGYEHIYATRIGIPKQNKMPKRIQDIFEADLGTLALNESDPNFYQKTLFNNMALCKGKNLQTAEEKSQLACWLDHKSNPYWRVNPLKVELLNKFPPITIIHELISTKWATELQSLASSKLERAPTGPEATPRTASYAWFKDKELSLGLSRRIEFATGFEVVRENASELLQVAAYAFGGHVDLHYDSRSPDDTNFDPKGERLMTVLIYLNDVPSGGFTSFPKLGFSVKPSRGSALLWHTNLKNGNVDLLTLHGACPVISGHKWIATKWIHSNENVFKRPCDLNQEL